MALMFIFGLIVGSFLNSVILRLHEHKNFVSERSRCPQCKQNLRWYELIPILSFLIQCGRCRACNKLISWQYPLVEFVTGTLFVLSYYALLPVKELSFIAYSLQLTAYSFFISILIVVFVYDYRWQLIPDKVTLPAVGIGILFGLIHTVLIESSLVHWFIGLLAAMVVGGGFFLLQFLVSKGRWIGGGDIRLGVLIGVILGWPQTVTALMIAYIFGALISVVLMVFRKKSLSSSLPFGTFLSVATVITLFWGDKLAGWYLRLI